MILRVWRKIVNATLNVEKIYIYTDQDFNELPQIIQNINGFKQLKRIIINIDDAFNGSQNFSGSRSQLDLMMIMTLTVWQKIDPY